MVHIPQAGRDRVTELNCTQDFASKAEAEMEAIAATKQIKTCSPHKLLWSPIPKALESQTFIQSLAVMILPQRMKLGTTSSERRRNRLMSLTVDDKELDG